jgi:hypothetical protein
MPHDERRKADDHVVGATLLTGLERKTLLTMLRVGIEVTLVSLDNNSMRKVVAATRGDQSNHRRVRTNEFGIQARRACQLVGGRGLLDSVLCVVFWEIDMVRGVGDDEPEGVHGRREKTEVERHDKERLLTTINNELGLQMDLLAVPGRSGLLSSFGAVVG